MTFPRRHERSGRWSTIPHRSIGGGPNRQLPEANRSVWKVSLCDQISSKMRPNHQIQYNRFLLSVCPVFSPIDLSGWMIRIIGKFFCRIETLNWEEIYVMIELIIGITGFCLLVNPLIVACKQFVLKPVPVRRPLWTGWHSVRQLGLRWQLQKNTGWT